MTRKSIVAVMFLVIGALPAMAAGTALSGDEIKATFGTGKPFTATSTTNGKAYWLTLKADGNAVEIAKRNNSERTGTWRVTDKTYCSKWGTDYEHCFTVQKNRTRYEVRDSGSHVIANWMP